MERSRTHPISSMSSPHNASPSTAVYFCSICNKPFTNANSRDRHCRYCGSHTRNRPRSCQTCNVAKTKCSFEVPCSRCKKRGIECVYDGLGAAARRMLPRSAAAGHAVTVESCERPSTTFISGASHVDDGISPTGEFAFTDDPGVNEDPPDIFGGDMHRQVDLTAQTSPPKEFHNFDEMFAFEGDLLDEQGFLIDVSLALQDTQDQKSGSWCLWMHGDVSLAVVTENPPVTLNPNLTALASGRPHAQHNANIIIQSLRAFPTMMLRRETFPWFIHPHSHLLSEPTGAALPEVLSKCMSVAQMFVSRTSETRYFLRQTITTESRQCVSEIHHMSKFELLTASQACLIYLIMYIIDYSPADEENARELLSALVDLYIQFKEVGEACSSQSGLSKASTVWEDWIFAESQRRYTNLWLLVGCVVCIKNGNVWDASKGYRTVPLPSPKSLWEASTQSSWESEYEACRNLHASGLVTLGDLIDAQQSSHTPSNARKLDKWNAGVDNLGCLLNLVGAME